MVYEDHGELGRNQIPMQLVLSPNSHEGSWEARGEEVVCQGLLLFLLSNLTQFYYLTVPQVRDTGLTGLNARYG